MRPVDVVKADDAELDLGEVDAVPPAALLRHDLLEAICILRVRRPRVLLLEAGAEVGFELLVLRVDARARGVQEALDAVLARSLDHVERDHGVVVQDARVVRLRVGTRFVSQCPRAMRTHAAPSNPQSH